VLEEYFGWGTKDESGTRKQEENPCLVERHDDAKGICAKGSSSFVFPNQAGKSCFPDTQTIIGFL